MVKSDESRSRCKNRGAPSSKYVGVKQTQSGKWSARIHDPFRRVDLWLGTFDTPQEASNAYQLKKLQFANSKLNPNKYHLRSSGKAPPNSNKASHSLSAQIPAPETPTPTPTLISLIVSYIEEQKSLKSILKPLYCLICSSLSYEVSQGNLGETAVRNGFGLKLEATVTLTVILFKELQKKLLTTSDGQGNAELDIMYVDGKDSQEELLLLLRCCVLLARLHRCNPALTEQLQVAVWLFRKLCFRGMQLPTSMEGRASRFSILIPCQSSCSKSSSRNFNAKSHELHLCFFQRMQEVYLDEIFGDRAFLEYIAFSDTVSSYCQNLPVHCSIQIDSVLEVIAAHFLLDLSGENVLQTFIESLTWKDKHAHSSSEVSLSVALSLMNHPVMKSAPTLLISHLISLTSEVIGIQIYPEKVGQSVGCRQKYLSAFHDSVNLFCEYMSNLMTGFCSPGRIVQRPFEFCFQSKAYEKIDFVLDDLDRVWREQRCKMFNKAVCSVAMDAISYIKMNICIVDETYRTEVSSFLTSLITRLVSVEVDEVLLHSFKEITLQDFCSLVSILKLMSCCLLQATHFSKMNLGCFIALLERKPDFMTFFAQCNLHVPIQIQQFIIHVLKLENSTHEEVKSIFFYFVGFVSLSMVSGLQILVRGCLFFLLVLVDSLALELGSFELLRQSRKTGEELPACLVPNIDTSSPASLGVSRKKSSLRVASNFRKERQILVRLFRDQTSSDVSESSDEETCNGVAFLKSISAKQEDINELKDFIECRPWRDYTARVSCKSKIKCKKMNQSYRRLRMAKMQVHNAAKNKRNVKNYFSKSMKYQQV